MHELNKILKPKSEEDILKAIDVSGLSPDELLIKSTKVGFTKGVQLAIERGADVHFKNDWALHIASRYDHLEVVKLLLKAGANIHALNDYALDIASRNGHIEVAKLLSYHISNKFLVFYTMIL